MIPASRAPRLTLGALVLALLLPAPAAAQALPAIARTKLPNGLEVIAFRDSSVPLARVELVFRAGAVAQAPETAGWFHLIEHLLFGGHAAEPGTGTRRELALLGASEWNGGAGAESVSLWLSLPSAKVRAGMEFWAKALAAPPFTAAAVERERQVVLREIAARALDPDQVYEAAMTRRLFAKYPWRRDPAGSAATIAAAGPEGLERLRATWFLPNNAALVVGGDIDPELVLRQAAEIFGSWARGPDPWAKPPLPQPRLAITRPAWLVFPDPSMPEGLAMVEARYRGPDLGVDPAGAAAADLWTSLVSDPAGAFKKAIARDVPGLQGGDPVAAYYVSQREGGLLSISGFFSVDPAKPAVDRARAFKERVRGFEITAMKSDPAYFSPAEWSAARRRLADARALSTETADELVDLLAFWWASASVDYFLELPSLLGKTGQREVVAMLDLYVLKSLEVVALRMNPADFERERKAFAGSGFETVDAESAFWWKKP